MSKDNENEKSPKPKFLNRSERNKNVVTDAMKIFGNSPLLEKRPEGMTTDEYKLARKIQTIILKRLFPKAPLRKLSGIMGQRPAKYSTSKGFRKSITQRKAS